MAHSNSSSPKSNQKLEAMVVAMEEKRTMNDPKQGSPQEVVLERTITEVTSERKISEKLNVGLCVLRSAKSVMKNDQPRDNILHICDICKREFCSASNLYRHQNIHKVDHELERILKKTKPSYSRGQSFWKEPYNSYQGTSNSVDVGGYSKDALSNDKDLGIYRDPSESIGGDGRSIRSITFPPFNSGFTRDNTDIDMAVGYPVAPYGYTRHGFSSGTPLVTHNNKNLTLVSKRDNNKNHLSLSDFNCRGLSFGPFKSKGVGSSSDYPSFNNGGITMAPPATPYRYFTQNTSYASSSTDPLSLELSLGPPNDIGSCSNNNNNNSSSQGSFSPELSLGPSKSTGDSNTNSRDSVYPSFNGRVTGRELAGLNMPVRPRVSRYHFYSHNPLDSITRNVPLSHPPPPPTTNPPNEENVSGSDRKGKKPKS